MMRAAVAERLPNISICHGPTITGPGPQAARNLGLATLEAMEQRWR